jgi:hypothetical protein
MNRYVVATAALVTVLAVAGGVAFALRGGGDHASSAGSIPGAPAADTTATAKPPPCAVADFLPVLKHAMDNEAGPVPLRIVRAEVARCRNGYARVFAVPDESVCPAGPCIEHEQVFLGWAGAEWRVLTSGTGIACEAGDETARVVRRACEGLGYPQATLLSMRTFRMPSGNIGCALAGTLLRCDILSGLKPEPSRVCELDWVGLVLPQEGMPEPNCAGDTVYDQAAPTLAYGAIWVRAGFKCYSMKSGLLCLAPRGGEFTLAREGWKGS